MMIKVTENISEIVKYSSMWNMAGLFLIGFCEQDYDSLRKRIHIPFVVMDGFFEPKEKCGNVSIDDFAGGYLMGKYLISKGHENIMYMSDNNMCMDHKRYLGLIKALDENNVNKDYLKLEIVPFYKNERINYYKELENNILNYTAIFCASDKYAIEIINYLTDCGYNVPNDVSVVGFDDIPSSEIVRPALTTIRQNMKMRAEKAMLILTGLINKNIKENNIILPVELIERYSVKSLLEGNK